MKPSNYYRTWIEIDAKKLRANVSEFFKLIGQRRNNVPGFIPEKTIFIAVIKSNAYGHGISGIARELLRHQEFKTRGWFGVDSIVEALRLRKIGIKNPILNLGYILPSKLLQASKNNIAVTVSTFEMLVALRRVKKPVAIHLKFDTGMRRQGFYAEHIPEIIKQLIAMPHIAAQGIYTHLADPEHLARAKRQLDEFKRIIKPMKKFYPDILTHALSSGGVLFHPNAHYDAVRIGMGMYGYFPSSKAEKYAARKVSLQPALAWKSVISEIKYAKKGEYVGYDFTERLSRDSKLAVVPVGYWHGFDRGLSSRGEVLIRGKRAKIIGRVSMDMITVDITGVPSASVMDEVVIIGHSGEKIITAENLAKRLNTTPYEVLTRLNPLIKRINYRKSDFL